MDIQIDTPSLAAEADLPEIAQLLGSVFSRERDWSADLSWQYLHNPCGRAWYANARDENGALVGHYAVIPGPEIATAKYNKFKTFVSLNTAVHPKAQGRGIFQASAAALFEHLSEQHPTLILGVANGNSIKGFVNYLGFYDLGKMQLRFFLPWQRPAPVADRLLSVNTRLLAWRASRPGTSVVKDTGTGTLSRLIRHKGIPIESVLTTGIASEILEGVDVPARGPMPKRLRLYATSQRDSIGGIPVLERFRPSPLHYICRVLPDENAAGLVNLVNGRRFEFLDFDVQ